MVRSKAQDAQPGTVTVDQLAFGLAALDCTVWEDPGAVWRAMDYRARDEYLAKARFALGLAEETTDVELGELRWRSEPAPAGVVVSGRLVPGRSGMAVPQDSRVIPKDELGLLAPGQLVKGPPKPSGEES